MRDCRLEQAALNEVTVQPKTLSWITCILLLNIYMFRALGTPQVYPICWMYFYFINWRKR